jgi:DNA-binding NarL/FixJ family response regulator
VNRTRVLLVEDHGLVRAGLRAMIEELDDVEVVGEAADGAEGLRLTAELRPDVVLMDISMPGLNGLEATRRAARMQPAPKILVLSMHADRAYVREALAAGATGYLLKDSERSELVLALAAVASGQGWISPAVARGVIDDAVQRPNDQVPRAAIEDLTARQREVLQLIAEGNSTKQIAQRLELSVKTVETHRAQIMARLDIRHVAGLVRYALRAGIVAEED